MTAPAPGLFSMTTGWPRYLAAISANLCRCVSVVPPAGQGQIRVTGFAGKDCAAAALASAMSATVTMARMLSSSAGDYSQRPPLK